MKGKGLSDLEVQEARKTYGSNQMTEQKRDSFWKKLLGNFSDPIIRILCVALVLNLVFVLLGETAWYEAFGIAVAVLLAVFVSTFSEYRNESAFQRLKEEASQILCKGYRNGQLTELPISDIVVGDWVLLQAGDKVPADGRMVEGNVKVDQSALNGEAEEVEKTPDDTKEGMGVPDFLSQDQTFRGSVVVSGTGIMEVYTVGDASVYGALASELQIHDERDTPLKVKLKKLAKDISRFGYIGGIVIAIVFLAQRVLVQNDFDPALISLYWGNGTPFLADLLEAVMLAVIIIVMAVPEGLPLMIAIVSALNMGKMLRDQVLVRKVAGIETAGSLNVLFSDKTGTITKGQLEVVTFLDGDGKASGNFSDVEAGLSTLLMLSMTYNSNAVRAEKADGSVQYYLGGNATERAMLQFVGEATGPDVTVLTNVPFSSVNKYSMATISSEQQAMTLLKGAPEKILPYCNQYYSGKGELFPLDKARLSVLNGKIDEMAKRSIRVLVLASAPEEREEENLFQEAWTLIGIVGIRDDVRPEAITAIREVQRAGVQVVMITGDRKDTATAIASESGIIDKKTDIVMTSDELQALSDEEVKERLPKLRVIARALPSDKSRLVRLAQEMDLVVGMTGDGVNDSPALHRADVGFAMGSGTEVAKEAGEIVILDDNFQSVAKAILYGRTIFNSIRKFIIFQLTINVAAVLVSFLAPLLGVDPPLTIPQILWINLVMDTLAALAFGGEPALPQYMKEAPRRRNEPIVSGAMQSAILVGSLYILVAGLLLLMVSGMQDVFRQMPDNRYLLTGYFTFFIFAAIFNAFNARSEGINLLSHIKENLNFLKVMGLIVVVQVVLTQIGGVVFGCYGLTITEWGLVLGLAILIIPLDLLRKAIVGKSKAKKHSEKEIRKWSKA